MTQESVGVLAQMLLSFKSLKTRDFISQRLVWRVCYDRCHSFQQRVNSLVLHAQFSYGGRRRGQGGAVEAPCARDARSRITGAVSFCGVEERSRLDFSLFRWLHRLGLDSYAREAPSVLGGSLQPGCSEFFSAKCRVFLWLTLQDRCWTAERRRQHDRLQSDNVCALCCRILKPSNTSSLGCIYSRETWFKSLHKFGWQLMARTIAQMTFADWWLQARKRVVKTRPKGFESLTMLVAWQLWFQRNICICEGK
jgi:hypothetical protein